MWTLPEAHRLNERLGRFAGIIRVHIAARITGCAAGGEVLCSRTVKDRVVGSELRFEALGERELRGFDEPWAVYALARDGIRQP